MTIKKINIIILTGLMFCFSVANGQIGVNTQTPEATLDVRAKNHLGAVTSKDGVLVPRVNDLSTNGSVNGQLVYLIEDASGGFSKGFYYWNGTIWTPFAGGGSASGDPTKDAWTDDATNKQVKLGTKSDESARLAGTEFVANDNGNVGMGTSSPNNYSKLDVISENQGLLIPRVALSSSKHDLNADGDNDVSNQPAGLMVYNTATAGTGFDNVIPGYYYWDGAKWMSMGGFSMDSNFIVGETKSVRIAVPKTLMETQGSTNKMFGKSVTNTGTINWPPAYENASAEDKSKFIIINGLRMDFMNMIGGAVSPELYNTTSNPITYNVSTLSTVNAYTSGVNTTIAPGYYSFLIDGADGLGVFGEQGEYVNCMLTFNTGEWYNCTWHAMMDSNYFYFYMTAMRLN